MVSESCTAEHDIMNNCIILYNTSTDGEMEEYYLPNYDYCRCFLSSGLLFSIASGFIIPQSIYHIGAALEMGYILGHYEIEVIDGCYGSPRMHSFAEN